MQRIDVEVGLVTAGAVFVSVERVVPPGGEEGRRGEEERSGEEGPTVEGAEGVSAGHGWGRGFVINEWQVWEANGLGAGHGLAWCAAVQDQQQTSGAAGAAGVAGATGAAGAAGAVGGVGAEEEEQKEGSVAGNGQASADDGGEVVSKAGEAGVFKGRRDVLEVVASRKSYIYSDFI